MQGIAVLFMGKRRGIIMMKLLTDLPWLPIEPCPYTSADTGGAGKPWKRLIYSNKTVTKYTAIRQSTTMHEIPDHGC